MRELTLLETCYLAGALLVSLLLPLLVSFRRPRQPAARRSWMRAVWAGQAGLAVAGLTVIASVSLAPHALGGGLLGCVACAFVILRR